MEKIKIVDKNIQYKLKKSRRAKCLRLSINHRAELVVTVPFLVPKFFVTRFIREKADWILRSLSLMNEKRKLVEQSEEIYGSYWKNKAKAALFIRERVKYFAHKHNFSYEKIIIKNQKSRWGSCSAKNNLNFNYRLLFIEPELADYVVVHELCHLREMNHSRKFWNQVESILPDWKERRRELKKVVF
jgi:predicted metal-dependent hydrolase